jgi:hypothetical protein
MAGFLSLDELFEGRHFDRETIVLCVRWYLRFKLSFRDLVEIMAERGLSLAHTTIMCRVHHYAPEFERRWNRFARSAGPSWRVDEIYVKIRGEYLCRAADRAGNTVDVRLSTRRDVASCRSGGDPKAAASMSDGTIAYRIARRSRASLNTPALVLKIMALAFGEFTSPCFTLGWLASRAYASGVSKSAKWNCPLNRPSTRVTGLGTGTDLNSSIKA